MSLLQLTSRVYCWSGGVNFGLVLGEDRQLVLIDSGLDAHAARKAMRPWLETGWRLAAIVNTHSHADHCGGNAELVRRTGARVFAPPVEEVVIRRPDLEPLYLYGGAYPPPTLQVKFLQALPSPVDVVYPPEVPFTVAGIELSPVFLPGHAVFQVGLAVDGVLFAADGLFVAEVLAKHPITFMVHLEQAYASLNRLAERPELWVVPGHGAPLDRRAGPDPLPAAIEHYRASLAALTDLCLEALSRPAAGESVLYHVCGRLGKVLESDPQYHLDRTTVDAHLSYLCHLGAVEVVFDGGRRLWRRSAK